MEAVFPEMWFFDHYVMNKMKLMRCIFIFKNFINSTDERRIATSVNRYTWNKYRLNIYNTFGDKIFISFCIENVIYTHVQNSSTVLTFVSFNIDWI